MKHRYTYSKKDFTTGQMIEGRGWLKSVARKRFYTILDRFRNRRNRGLEAVDSFGNGGQVYIRKELAKWYLDELEKKEKR